MCILLSLIAYNCILEIIVKNNKIRKESKNALELTEVILIYLEKEIILFFRLYPRQQLTKRKKRILKTHKECGSNCLIIQLPDK